MYATTHTNAVDKFCASLGEIAKTQNTLELFIYNFFSVWVCPPMYKFNKILQTIL